MSSQHARSGLSGSQAPPLGSHLASWTVTGLVEKAPKIKDCKVLAYFDWVDSSRPAIINPGKFLCRRKTALLTTA